MGLAHGRPPLPIDRELTVMALIEVEDLSRTFVVRRRTGRVRRTAAEVRAVDHLSFEVERGEMVGYIGPNGAGKSTTIRMLTDILTYWWCARLMDL
jgi:ABC-2 type transport system ATP-binding protein